MPGERFTIMYGNYALSRRTGRVSVTAMKQEGDGNHLRLAQVFKKNGRVVATSAAMDGSQLAGTWYSSHFLIGNGEGKVIRVSASLTRKGRAYANAAVFILIDPTGPTNRVAIDFNDSNTHLTYNSVVGFSGPGWVLEEDELPKYGIEVYPAYTRKWMDPEELEELVTVDRLAREVRGKMEFIKVHDNEVGDRLVRVTPPPPRRVVVRKKR